MGFQKLQKSSRGTKQSGVRLQSRFNQYGNLSVLVHVGIDVLEQMGFKHGQRVHLMLGDRNDRGLLRLLKTEDETAHTLVKNSGRTNSARVVKVLPDRKWIKGAHGLTKCAHRLNRVEGTIEIELPDWAGGPPQFRNMNVKAQPQHLRLA